jgi:hypothetical protein
MVSSKVQNPSDWELSCFVWSQIKGSGDSGNVSSEPDWAYWPEIAPFGSSTDSWSKVGSTLTGASDDFITVEWTMRCYHGSNSRSSVTLKPSMELKGSERIRIDR